MKKILIVDDEKMNLKLATKVLMNTYEVDSCISANEMFDYLKEKELPDLILLDIEMPELNGIEAMKLIVADERWKKIPVVFLTGDSDSTTEVECLRLGASDFITKPFVPMVMQMRIDRILQLNDLQENLEQRLEEKTREVEMVAVNAIMSIASTIDAKDKYTSGHSARVAEWSVAYAKELNWPEDKIQNIRLVALLHDIGKIGIPDAILNKPTNLTDEEFVIIKKHPVIGGEILKDVRVIEHVKEGALYHHERFDGTGYPFGLKGTEIPLYARIICVADTYDAMTSGRVYRDDAGLEEVIKELERNRGTQFDPEVLDTYITLFRKGIRVNADLDNIREKIEGYH